jgi:hypothetical protein
MTPARIAQARSLYEQRRWSTAKIGAEFGVSQSTVYSALVRDGVTMRKPVA